MVALANNFDKINDCYREALRKHSTIHHIFLLTYVATYIAIENTCLLLVLWGYERKCHFGPLTFPTD